ncbi:structural maintenance of chromosomes protein 4-like [Xenia sp. Carnegie-2017]|uniref:structural maintenance of chromosomes protein 4-like n=1 Tax=Xenia sp. Carnegie-2017 TaxID=2897299 RepID=UPI001F04F39D|nr:structural maintenance of chromosomes protein 4-like [Xenia sp. Carnegie-2017]
MNYFTCELATSTTRETLYKQKIGSMEITLDKIENESKINVVTNNDNNERKTGLLNDMKIVEETPMNAESKLNETTLEKEKLFNANQKMSTVVKELKNTIASINNEDKKNFKIIDDLKCQLDVAKEVKQYLENQIQIMEKMREWSKTLKKSHSSNKTLSLKISHVNNDISKIEEEKNLHNDRNSLQQKNEPRDLEFESKNNEIRTLEARVDELQNQKNQLNICVKYEKDQLLVLNIQFQELEKIKVSLEEKMRKQQNQLGSTLLELLSAKATIKELESVKEELNSKISLLVEEKELFQKSNDDMKMEIRKLKNELSDKVLEHSSLLQEYNATKNEKNVAVALLKKNESELCLIKQNACDLITKKKTLEVEITNFKVIFEQLEFVHQELRTANVQLQESNKRLERELEKLKNGSHAN